MLRHSFEATEADFQRFYRIDLGELWTGELKPRRAARLASQLPPGAAVFRPAGLDSQIYSLEAQLLRTWINMNIENEQHQIPTAEKAAEKAEQQERVRERVRRRTQQRLAQRGQVSDG